MLDYVTHPRANLISAARIEHRHDDQNGYREWLWQASIDPCGKRHTGNFSRVAIAPVAIQRAAENGRGAPHLDVRGVLLVHKGRALKASGEEIEIASGVGLASGDIYVTLATQFDGSETLLEPIEIHVDCHEPLRNEVAPLAASYTGHKRSS